MRSTHYRKIRRSPAIIGFLIMLALITNVHAIEPSGSMQPLANEGVFSSARSSFKVPPALKESYDRFKNTSGLKFALKCLTFVVFAVPVSAVAFLLGVFLLPVEIIVFVIAAISTKDLFWLTMIVTWKYVVLFMAIF